jgi:hypothetical protein
MRNTALAVKQTDMARPTANTVQITFRIPTEWLAEADLAADRLSSPGMRASRTDAFRAAIARGFEVMKAERKAPASEPSKPSKKR